MSKAELLTEDEIRTYLQHYFKLNLTREALMKPTKETVSEIYTLFMDNFQIDRTKHPERILDDEEPNPKYLIVRVMNQIMPNFNLNITFQYSDLVMPNRKRTVAFLNVLIYIKAQFDDAGAIYEKWVNENSHERDEIGKISIELANLREEREELVYKLSKMGSYDERAADVDARREQIKSIEKEAEKYYTVGKAHKNNRQLIAEENQKAESDVESRKEQVAKEEENLHLLNDGISLKKRILDLKGSINQRQEKCKQIEMSLSMRTKKIAELKKLLASTEASKGFDSKDIKEEIGRLENDYSSLKLFEKTANEVQSERAEAESKKRQLENHENLTGVQYDIKRGSIESVLNEKLNQSKALITRRKEIYNSFKQDFDKIEMKRRDLARDRLEQEERYKNNLEKLNLHRDIWRRLQDKSDKMSIEFRTAFHNYQVKSNLFLGKTPTYNLTLGNNTITSNTTASTIREIPADRTYIKESHKISN